MLTNGDISIIKNSLICLYLENDKIIDRTEYEDIKEWYKSDNKEIDSLFQKLFHMNIEEYFENK